MNSQNISSLLETSELPSLGPQPRPSRKSQSVLEIDLKAAFTESKWSPQTQDLIRALVLLWHDYLDEAHSIVQDLSNPDGSFVHAIVHRREPDFWNSKYWFNRVGQHAVFSELAAQSDPVLKSAPQTLQKLRGEKWNPNLFVDLCEQFAEERATEEYKILQKIQQVEFRVLLNHFARPDR